MWVFLGHLIIDFLATVGRTASGRSVKCPKLDLNRSSTATDGPILVQKVSKHMFFGSGNPFLPLPKLYSGYEFKASGFHISANLVSEFRRPLGTPPKVAAKKIVGEKLLKTLT